MSMPQPPDGQPETGAPHAQGVDAALTADGRTEPEAPAAGPGQDVPQVAQTGDPPQRRRRRRRRRRRPRPDLAGASSAVAPAEGSDAQPQPVDPLTPAEGLAPPAKQADATAPAAGSPPRKRRRRRRRRPAPEGSAMSAAAGEPTAAVSGDAVQSSAAATEWKEPRRGRGSRRGDGPDRRPREEQPRERDNRREQSSGPRAEADGGPRRKRDKRGARASAGRPHHRDRDDARNKPAPKLNRLEAVVDRGFEDVPDAAAEGGTSRADWTILKRTIVDQRTTRAVSVVYVLRRQGVETEFAQLSAARGAVNKIITHPEKLTPSKSDHAAAKGAKK
jgi:hypothetical protein